MRRKLLLIALTLAAALCLSGHGEAAWAETVTIKTSADFDPLATNHTATEVVISDGIEKIPPKAFEKWTNLKTVTINSDDLKTIGDSAFNGCTDLESVTFPEGAQLESIGDSAFSTCIKLKSITFPEDMTSLKSIGNSAFSTCQALESLNWKNALEHIGYQAFGSCYNLNQIGDCSGLKEIGAGAFGGTALTSFTWPAGAKEVDAEGNLSEKAGVSSEAFNGCTALTTVILPEDITYIGDAAFSGCAALATVSTSTENPQEGIHFPESITSYGKNALARVPITEFTLPNNMTTVPDGLFQGCTALKSVTLHNGVTSIGLRAFEGCTELKSIVLPDEVTTIAQGAFKGSGLTSITIPQNVTLLGELDGHTSDYGVFQGCASLEKVTLPATLKAIGMNAFKDCTDLTAITVADDPSGKNKLPASLVTDGSETETGVGDDAFSGCENLKTLSYPQHLDLTEAGIPEGAEWNGYEWEKHTWSEEPVWEWDEDYTSATATFICSKDVMGDHSAIISAKITSSTTTTCTEAGKTTYTASVEFNGKTYTDTKVVNTPAHHNWSATWTSDASGHWHKCENCEETKDFAEHIAEADDGDCTTAVKCSVCGYEIIAAQEHNFGEWTSNDDGTHGRHCLREGCNATETQNCTYENGVCTVCGYVQPATDPDPDPEPEPDDPSTPVTPSDPDPEIEVTEPAHGDVEISPSKPEAGETVTITPMPDAGYEVEEVIVTDEDGERVPVTENPDGSWSYEQPESDVTIEVIFGEVEPEPTVDVSEIFLDVDPDAWYKDAVQFAYDHGLMTGVSATEFAPDVTTTRAMIVSILARLEGVTAADDAGFSDVDDEWFATAVNWAASVGVVNGFEDNTFRPNDAITREQLAAILCNYAAWKGEDVSARADLSAYSDAAAISSWATDVMRWAVAENLISGVTTDALQPQGAATRAQVAAILQRFLSK